MRRRLAAALIAASLPLAQARADSVTAVSEPARNYGNLRIGGGTSTEEGHADVCLELSPFAFLAIEGCGTGSGFLHHDDATETAHFRSKLRVADFAWQQGRLQPTLSLGFTELQVGEDASGFDFSGTGPHGVETAGPEAGASLRYLRPLGRGLELVGDVSASVAYLPHAPDLVIPHDRVHVTATATLGVGF